MRQIAVGGAGVDAGPTVFTMRWIFESLFADCGSRLTDHLELTPLEILARHAWRSGGRLDLFADVERSAEAIGDFAGAADARGYREFCLRSADVYRTLASPFIEAQKPSPLELVRRVGLGNVDALWRTAPLQTFWGALAQHFRDPRLRQLFGRYATYVGSSPMLAPATLMLIAHVEQEGVWTVRGGMRQVAQALCELGGSQGARYRYGADVSAIDVKGSRACGVRLADGEFLPADVIVHNGDISALADGALGDAVRRAAPSTARAERTLSAITWCVRGRCEGFDLAHHNVFFGDDYASEFASVFRERCICREPTVYVCAQDRGAAAEASGDGLERLLLLINAPADGDQGAMAPEALARSEQAATSLLAQCGLKIEAAQQHRVITTPREFAQLFPATGGALYGRANHGGFATFKRPGSRTKVPGLYAAGGSVHPGPGVPMALMSGRLAAARIIQDRERSGA